MDPVQARVALSAADPPDNLIKHHENPARCLSDDAGQGLIT